jgi:hypothetical protein
MTRIYLLHENEAWVAPLHAALDGLGVPHEDWFLDAGTVPLDRTPPPGVFYSRMSASCHSRDHHDAPDFARAALTWLEAHGRRVVNGTRALALELSKAAQYAAFIQAGIRVPRSLAAVGRAETLAAARSLGPGPYILKPNRGGKGLGVRLFQSAEEMDGTLTALGEEERPVDGLWLIQDYVASPEPFITRCEFIGGRFHYAVRVDTRGGFELCPADACEIDGPEGPTDRFIIDPRFDHQILHDYQRFLKSNGVEIAGIEFVRDATGRIFTYDLNCNTNYNAQAEAKAGLPLTGAQAVASFLAEELEKLPEAAAAE